MIGSAIVTRELVKRRGKRRALDGLTLSVPRGSILGLVGENGAGKTTWMMTVAGFLRPDSGEIDLLGMGPFDAERHAGRISILPQDSELPLESTPKGALYRFGRLQGLSPDAARRSAHDALAAVNLLDRADAAVRTLSHGMRKRAMVAQCFVGNPEIVLLDEPLNGLDPVEADRLRRFIASQRGLMSPHSLSYLVLNFVGSAILAVLAAMHSDWGFLLLEGVWALVSGWALIELARGREPGGANH
jgi:ABC-type multidrug transport system ATPase subunit